MLFRLAHHLDQEVQVVGRVIEQQHNIIIHHSPIFFGNLSLFHSFANFYLLTAWQEEHGTNGETMR